MTIQTSPSPLNSRPVENAFVHQRVADVDVVRVFGEVDLASVGQFEEALRTAARPDARIVVDLRTCTYMDSTVLAALVRSEKLYRGFFALILPEDGAVRRLFAITSLLQHFSIVEAI